MTINGRALVLTWFLFPGYDPWWNKLPIAGHPASFRRFLGQLSEFDARTYTTFTHTG